MLCGINKESTIPFAVTIAGSWLLPEFVKGKFRIGPMISVVLLGACALGTFEALRIAYSSGLPWPWQYVPTGAVSHGRILTGLIAFFLNKSFYYTFLWILPLGVLGIRYIPRSWAVASICAFVVGLLLSASIYVGNNIGRPLFNVVGPMLSLAAGLFIWRFLGERRQ